MFALIDAISNEFVHGQPLKGALKSRPPFEFNYMLCTLWLLQHDWVKSFLKDNFLFLAPLFSLEIPSFINTIVSIGKVFGPFILRPRFLQFVEIWFEKSGSRKVVQEKWFEKSG